MKKCKSIEIGQCVGDGNIPKDRFNFCTNQCRINFINNRKKNTSVDNRYDKIITNRHGCTIKPSNDGRCEKHNECQFYNECLELVWLFKSDGFESDCKGFQQKEIDPDIKYWKYTCDYDEEFHLNKG